MAPLTVVQAIKQVMAQSGRPLSVAEAYAAIVKDNVYEFHADSPVHVVRSQIRRYCEGIDFPSSSPTKHFRLVDGNKYVPLETPVKVAVTKSIVKSDFCLSPGDHSGEISFNELQVIHERYIRKVKRNIISGLIDLSPQAFEIFAKRLIDAYGFDDTIVTHVSGDGGIDGHGKLKVGLASLNVAFQCKKWSKGKIQRPEIDKFRGAAQGDFEQGIFFTTSSFSKGAIDISIKRGAVPIVLIDGEAIADLMIAKGFGVQIETLSIPILALDVILEGDDSSQSA
jgi:restriction system protein